MACRLASQVGDDVLRLSQRVEYLRVGCNATLAQIPAKLLSQLSQASALRLDFLALLVDSPSDDAYGDGSGHDDG